MVKPPYDLTSGLLFSDMNHFIIPIRFYFFLFVLIRMASFYPKILFILTYLIDLLFFK